VVPISEPVVLFLLLLLFGWIRFRSSIPGSLQASRDDGTLAVLCSDIARLVPESPSSLGLWTWKPLRFFPFSRPDAAATVRARSVTLMHMIFFSLSELNQSAEETN
jgi:hypothetical protein